MTATDMTAESSDAGSRSDDARAAITRYLEALERFDVDAAVACFSEQVEYSHAPFRHQPGTGRRVARGRDALRRLFEARGPLPITHDIDVVAANGDRCFASGFVRDGDQVQASFVADFGLSGDGLITTYVGYSTAPPARLREPDENGFRLPS